MRVLHLSYRIDTNDATGLLEECCCITLFGVLRPAQLRYAGSGQLPDDCYDLLFDSNIAISAISVKKPTNHGLFRLDTMDGINLSGLYLLPLKLLEDEDRQHKLRGLLLTRPYSENRSKYRRMGYFETPVFVQIFYKMRSPTVPTLMNGNPWDHLERYSKSTEEATRENDFLDLFSDELVGEASQTGHLVWTRLQQ
jgi:hypothetical protein